MTESGPDVSSEDQDMLGSLMRHLLPPPAVSLPRATPIPSGFFLLNVLRPLFCALTLG